MPQHHSMCSIGSLQTALLQQDMHPAACERILPPSAGSVLRTETQSETFLAFSWSCRIHVGVE
jgi:hypothetical protein